MHNRDIVGDGIALTFWIGAFRRADHVLLLLIQAARSLTSPNSLASARSALSPRRLPTGGANCFPDPLRPPLGLSFAGAWGRLRASQVPVPVGT